ncbi:MAG: hypothetical protein ABJF23_17835 [Bryobacteraceae bacterium]
MAITTLSSREFNQDASRANTTARDLYDAYGLLLTTVNFQMHSAG